MVLNIKGKLTASHNRVGLSMGEGTQAFLGDADLSHNTEVGAELHSTAELSADNIDASHSGIGILVGSEKRIVDRARADGLAPDNLNDNEVFKALQAVHDAPVSEREKALVQGPLWPTLVMGGMQAAELVYTILGYYKHP